jgi:hypothetical protein
MIMRITSALLLSWLLSATTVAQTVPPPATQNPSPMVENSRAHARVPQTEIKGQRWKLSTGTLLLPASARVRPVMPLYVHFHGAPWLAEWSVQRRDRTAAILTIHLGAGSGVYSRAFSDPATFAALLDEAAKQLSPQSLPRFHPVVISSFSAGYGAVREILKNAANWERIDSVVLMDSMHTGYTTGGQPGPIETEPLQPFVDFAKAAVAGGKTLIVTHSEIFPGTFASTTETSNYVLNQLGLKRKPVLKWGPVGMQQTSEVRSGRFRLMGFAGNSAPDHIDHFHGLERWLKMAK